MELYFKTTQATIPGFEERSLSVGISTIVNAIIESGTDSRWLSGPAPAELVLTMVREADNRDLEHLIRLRNHFAKSHSLTAGWGKDETWREFSALLDIRLKEQSAKESV